MHQIKTRIGSLGLPPRLRGVTAAALIVFAVITLAFWIWAKPSLWVAVLMLALQALIVVGMVIILTGRLPTTLRRAASRSRRVFRFQIRGVQKPEELTQAQWDEVRAKRRKHRRMVLFLASTAGMILLITFVLRSWGLLGKILTPMLIYIYGWTVASRINVTKPYPGMTPERVGADVGEPVSASPDRLGMFSIALKWVRGNFPPKTEEKPKEEPRNVGLRVLCAASTVVLILVALKVRHLPTLAFFGLPLPLFCLFWVFLGWPAIRYTLGAGEDPDVSISKPRFGFLRMEVVVLYNKASAFNKGVTKTCPGGAVDWDPGVLAIGGGEVREAMNFPWCPEWFMRRVIETKGRRGS